MMTHVYNCAIPQAVSPSHAMGLVRLAFRLQGADDTNSFNGFEEWAKRFMHVSWSFSRSPAGVAHKKATGVEPYSLKFIMELASSDELVELVLRNLQQTGLREVDGNVLRFATAIQRNWLGSSCAEYKISVLSSLLYAYSSVLHSENFEETIAKCLAEAIPHYLLIQPK